MFYLDPGFELFRFKLCHNSVLNMNSNRNYTIITVLFTAKKTIFLQFELILKRFE
jgi:hypothetical protein